MRLRLWWLVLLVNWMFSVQAHETNNEYLNLDVSANKQYGIQGLLQLSLVNINHQVEIDSNQDGLLNGPEIMMHESLIKQFVQDKLSIHANQNRCFLRMPKPLTLNKPFDSRYLLIFFVADCVKDDVDNLLIHYTGIIEQDFVHKLIINVAGIGSDAKGIASDVISATHSQVRIDFQSSDFFSVLSSYLYQGIVHIFIGVDHILFLVVLLLTSVLIYQNGRWEAKLSNSQVLKDTAWIITAFTLAHSITLSATALGWLLPSSRWVEFGIALSIVLTALNNLWPLVTRLSWITFVFGLLHGMGFASVLGDLGLNENYTLLSILAFNLGVEVGQLTILLVLFPLLIFCRDKQWYRKYGLKIGSIIIGLIAVYWSIQRF